MVIWVFSLLQVLDNILCLIYLSCLFFFPPSCFYFILFFCYCYICSLLYFHVHVHFFPLFISFLNLFIHFLFIFLFFCLLFLPSNSAGFLRSVSSSWYKDVIMLKSCYCGNNGWTRRRQRSVGWRKKPWLCGNKRELEMSIKKPLRVKGGRSLKLARTQVNTRALRPTLTVRKVRLWGFDIKVYSKLLPS